MQGSRGRPWPDPHWEAPPYPKPSPDPWAHELRRIASGGFDFVRMEVQPGPLLADGAAARAQGVAEIRAAVRQALDAGLSVVVALQPSEAHEAWNGAAILGDPAKLALYEAAVHAVAAAIAPLDAERVALEPMNEPPLPCEAAAWPMAQRRLTAAARRAAPRLWLVLTGACMSTVAGLEALPNGPDDPRTLYTFHFYDPFVFTHQGSTWTTYEPVMRHLSAVPWPPEADPGPSLAAARASIAAAPGLTRPTREQLWDRAQTLMTAYVRDPTVPHVIERAFERLDAWRRARRVPASRILLGEFGVLKVEATWRGAAAADAARWIRAVREAAERRGVAWCLYSYTGGMSLVDDRGGWWPELVESLGVTNPKE